VKIAFYRYLVTLIAVAIAAATLWFLYVGAIAQRSVARVVGTIIGGFVGVWLVGNYEQDRLFFLLFTFGYLWLCMYMYGGTFFPYSFFLCANTLVTVSASGIFDPVNAWSVGISRTLEILTGVVSIIVVSHLLWPRFARHEFLGLAKSALGNIGKLVELRYRSPTHQGGCISGGPASGAKPWDEVQSTALAIRDQSLRLRALLQNGTNESLYFRRHLPSYTTAVVSLTHLFQASLELFRQQEGHPQYLADIGSELSAVYEAIELELQMLAGAVGSEKEIKNDRLKTTLQALEARIQNLLTSGAARNYPLEDVLDPANQQAALLTIYDEVLRLRAIVANLPLPGDPPTRERPPQFHWPRVSLSRLRDGLEPAIAGTAALLICQWFKPPGAAAIPLVALALTFYNKNFIGGKADRGALQRAFQVSVAGLFFIILVFWISPALSNYGVMNLFLFAELFAFGYWAAALGGQNIHADAVMFFIIATVGLDAEKPVGVQAVFNSYFGVVLPIFIAAIVGRLFWPVLPEAELRKRFIEFFSTCSSFLTKQPGQGDDAFSNRLTLIPIESASWAKGLKGRHCPDSEVEKIVALTPELLRRIILLGTGPRGGEGMTFTELSAEEKADPIRFLLDAFFAPSETSQTAGKAFLERLQWRRDDRDLPVSKRSAEAQLNAIREWGTIPSSGRYAMLQKIKHRVLIVHGNKDVVVQPINALILAERLPDAQLAVYPDSSHGVQYQHASLFLKHANLFLNA